MGVSSQHPAGTLPPSVGGGCSDVTTIRDWQVDHRYLRVTWADAHSSTFHFIWLRDNCACLHCGAHTSGSRFQSLLDIPPDIVPSSVRRDGPHLVITWATDGHESRFDERWLRAHCYSARERSRRSRART